MNIKFIRSFLLTSLVLSAGASSQYAYGVAPSVTAFSATPQSVNYGYMTNLSWTVANGAGHDLYFVCPSIGVKIKRDDGTAFPCNTKQSISTNSSDSASFYITNTTGNTITIPVRIIPRDSSSTSYDAAASTVTLVVGPVPHPITDFSYAAATPIAGTTPITLSWSGIEVTGVNLQFDCNDGITIYSTSPSVVDALKCGQPVYVSDLAASGTANVYFKNANAASIDESIKILPAISAGVYDATHALSVTVTVPSKPAPLPSSITGFSSSQTSASPGQNVNFTWSASNASGVNLQMPCNSSLTWSSVQGTTTSPLLCNVPGFSTALGTSASTTVVFSNSSTYPQSIPISIYPQNVDGTYDATKARVVTLTIYELGHVAVNPIPITTPPQATTSAPGAVPSTTSGGIKALHPVTFTVSLRLGSRGAQVTALQNFLKQDPSLYPEGKVTGYLGPATVAAIKRFQQRYGVAKPGDDGFGSFGPKTRAKFNSIQNF